LVQSTVVATREGVTGWQPLKRRELRQIQLGLDLLLMVLSEVKGRSQAT
jgi:hypothetical protein